MAQTDLLLTEPDRQRILSWVLAQGAAVVPDTFYEKPTYRSITAGADVSELAEYRQFFVLHADWQREELMMRPYCDKTRGDGYYVAPRYGGPTIDLSLYREHVDDTGHRAVARGTVGYYPFHYSTQDNSKMLPPTPLKALYSAFLKHYKTDATGIRTPKRVAWVSVDAICDIHAGRKVLPSEWQAATPVAARRVPRE